MRLVGVLIVAVGAAVVLLATAGRGAQAPSAPTARDLAMVAIATRIAGDDVHAAGVVVDPGRGLVVTSARAVWGARSVKVGTGLAVVFGRIVARDPCDDIAVVAMEPWLPGLSALRARTTAASGLRVTVVARPWTKRPVGRRPMLSVPAVLERSGSAASLSAPLPGYAAGAAVLDGRGQITGLVRATEPDRPAVLPWALVEKRLAQLRPGPGTLFVGWRDHYRCAPRLHALARAAHPGYTARDSVLNRPVPAGRLPGTQELDG